MKTIVKVVPLVLVLGSDWLLPTPPKPACSPASSRMGAAEYVSRLFGRNAARETGEAAARTATREGAEAVLRRGAGSVAVEESAELVGPQSRRQ